MMRTFLLAVAALASTLAAAIAAHNTAAISGANLPLRNAWI